MRFVFNKRFLVDFPGYFEESRSDVRFCGFEVRGMLREARGKAVGAVGEDDEVFLVEDVVLSREGDLHRFGGGGEVELGPGFGGIGCALCWVGGEMVTGACFDRAE